MFAEHPLIGVGNHNFAATLEGYKASGKTPAELGLFTHPHNDFLKFAAEGGLLGAAAILMLYFVPLTAGLRRYRLRPSAASPALPLVLLCSGFLLAGMVDVVLAWRPTITFYGLATSLLLVNMDSAGAERMITSTAFPWPTSMPAATTCGASSMPAACPTASSTPSASTSARGWPDIYARQQRLRHSGVDMRAGEMGCYLSHREIWKSFLASDDELCLVLEDDVEIGPDFAAVVNALCADPATGISCA